MLKRKRETKGEACASWDWQQVPDDLWKRTMNDEPCGVGFAQTNQRFYRLFGGCVAAVERARRTRDRVVWCRALLNSVDLSALTSHHLPGSPLASALVVPAFAPAFTEQLGDLRASIAGGWARKRLIKVLRRAGWPVCASLKARADDIDMFVAESQAVVRGLWYRLTEQDDEQKDGFATIWTSAQAVAPPNALSRHSALHIVLQPAESQLLGAFDLTCCQIAWVGPWAQPRVQVTAAAWFSLATGKAFQCWDTVDLFDLFPDRVLVSEPPTMDITTVPRWIKYRARGHTFPGLSPIQCRSALKIFHEVRDSANAAFYMQRCQEPGSRLGW